MKFKDDMVFLLTDEFTKNVFSKVLDERKVSFGDLRRKFGEENTKNLSDAIRKLSDFHLVETSEAPLIDFEVVFPTSEGLTIGRKLRLGESSFASSVKKFLAA